LRDDGGDGPGIGGAQGRPADRVCVTSDAVDTAALDDVTVAVDAVYDVGFCGSGRCVLSDGVRDDPWSEG
jgi:hypothetical protein